MKSSSAHFFANYEPPRKVHLATEDGPRCKTPGARQTTDDPDACTCEKCLLLFTKGICYRVR